MGNLQWSSWLDSLQPDRKESDGGSYEIFRFVNKIDLVPRLPLAIFSHVGHTLQITYGGEIEVRSRGRGDVHAILLALHLLDNRAASSGTGVLRSPGQRRPWIFERAIRVGR